MEKTVNTQKPRYDKNKAYRERMRESGKCPRCGKVCFPFSMCKEHRIYMNLHRSVMSMTKRGELLRVGDTFGINPNYTGKHRHYTKRQKQDRREQPRFGGSPMDSPWIVDALFACLAVKKKVMSELELKNILRKHR